MQKENLITTNPNEMNLVERVKAPTPKFFKTLRTIGLALAAIGGALLATPIALPAALYPPQQVHTLISVNSYQ